MAYVDTTLTVAGGYTNIHNGQIYDSLAAALTAQGNWEYVEYVTSVNGAITYRRHVWRCKAAGSGLPSDFYVVFMTSYPTATGFYETTWPVYLWLGETYSSSTLGKFATYNATAVTPASDLSNPATFLMTTYSVPNSIYMWGNTFGMSGNVTSLRMIYLVTADSIIITRASTAGAGAASTNNLLYVGAYQRVMSSTDDPMPLVLLGTSTATGDRTGAFTRSALMAPGVSATDTFSAASYTDGTTTPVATNGPGRNGMVPPTGQPGTAATTTYWKNLGPTVSRCPVNSWLSAATTGSTKGTFRGYLKNIVCANLAAHAFGDTFRVDGKVYAGIGVTGNAPLIDTTAV